MSTNALYADLSIYYDLMCTDIDYSAQSHCIQRLHQIFGNQKKQHLDLACGTGAHIRYFLNQAYISTGLDLHPAMLAQAQVRCPEADFILQDMSDFNIGTHFDLITCFLYSLHYNQGIEKLRTCFDSIYNALNPGGIFCFNWVDKYKINNKHFVKHHLTYENALFTFCSRWYYSGQGEMQALRLSIEKAHPDHTYLWQDEHPMVAMGIQELNDFLQPHFEVHLFEHDYDKIVPWDQVSGNAIFVCIKS
ncbi:Ubiquinone/menaquinone biosynthesis C-methylase UbiE [Allopseudospirillum japonicum]|uniref:Ubiquinone/menaquinone biosynthesis C-methylase UbiE n=1 Tax=Allopseudospirillum japonicum TaxID=64971 RepID=A0A1H6Q8V2_9GAMM|nr:class I SAM-dependent methyltransferase [Allopseudospirillum japonicum]SEI37254.1 Ubiquinone/menaquinone biosynthesis C-methylase UbiE [Allopseudospirillum japonicum]